jgi:hypothetical protein
MIQRRLALCTETRVSLLESLRWGVIAASFFPLFETRTYHPGNSEQSSEDDDQKSAERQIGITPGVRRAYDPPKGNLPHDNRKDD